MITEKELIDAIEACEKEPLTPSKIAKLADFYIIYDHLFGEPVGYRSNMSFAEPPAENILKTSGKTEFLQAIDGQPADKVLNIVSELVESIKLLHPRMYEHMITKLYNE